ncbi:hypothetical protein Glove_114g106 [Diversispora epigaea]|uniref:Uncharacterized protein n=1 Tax=Diversispora epigaea TaxID=1348612 RepID=A0A397JAE3_9GLOM|nr:hypothetical protein Glove_114g106 [Diversispora epigaea]
MLKAHRGKEIERVFIIGMSPVLINNISSSFGVSYDITLEQNFKYMYGLEEKDIKEALTYIFTEKEHYTDEEKQNFIKFHLKQIRIIYNKYKYEYTQDSGIYYTNVCLNYLQNLLDGKQIGNSNELDDNMLRFVGKYPYTRRYRKYQQYILEELYSSNTMLMGGSQFDTVSILRLAAITNMFLAGRI